MALWYASEAGSGLANGTSEADAWDIASIVWGTGGVDNGDTLYLMDTIITPVNVGKSGSNGSPITVRGDLAGRTCTMDAQNTTVDILVINIKFWVEVRNINFINPLAGSNQLLHINQSLTVSVFDCNFTGNATGNTLDGRAIKINAQGTANGCNRILVEGCTFTDMDDAALVLVNFATGQTSVPNRITYRNNSFTNCYRAIQYVMTRAPNWNQVLGGFTPWGIDYDGNTATDCTWAFIQIEWLDGFGTVNGAPSYFRNNTMIRIGDPLVAAINCIQMENCKGGYVEYNLVDGLTKVPVDGDGHAFIFDFVMDSTDPAFYTADVIVRYNIFKGANTVGTNMNCAGIKAFRGVDNITYGNYIEDCLSGIANSGVNSTGNIYDHNTCVDIHQRGLGVDQSSALCTYTNNIVKMRDGNVFGLATDLTAVDPVENNNIIFNATANNITPDVTTTFGDPLLDAAGKPLAGSPAIGTGTPGYDITAVMTISASGEPIPPVNPDRGYYQTTLDPNHPSNL